MTRVHHVNKARKSPGKCGRCDHRIKKGFPYKWWKFRRSGKYIRCADPACAPKPKDLTQSEFWSAVFGIQEERFELNTSIEDLESARDNVVGELENLRDEQEDKRSNMPEGLQEGDTGNLLQERFDALEEAVINLQNVDISYDPPEEVEEQDEAEDARMTEIADELQNALDDINCS